MKVKAILDLQKNQFALKRLDACMFVTNKWQRSVTEFFHRFLIKYIHVHVKKEPLVSFPELLSPVKNFLSTNCLSSWKKLTLSAWEAAFVAPLCKRPYSRKQHSISYDFISSLWAVRHIRQNVFTHVFLRWKSSLLYIYIYIDFDQDMQGEARKYYSKFKNI